jgi:hypothetical protein
VTVASVAAAPVDFLPPSPVPDTSPPTPTDAEDSGDPILQSVSDKPEQAPQSRRVGATVNQLSPQISVAVSPPIIPNGTPGVDMRYSIIGQPIG